MGELKKLGIIGGLGPAATAYFYGMLTELTDVQCDQQHLEIIIYSKPQIPDRTAYILHKSDESPVPMMITAANALIKLGVANIAIPCVTAHCFYDAIAQNTDVPAINILSETIDYLQLREIRRVGLMATDGLVESGIFSGFLEANGIDVLLPHEGEQAQIMQTIYEYKANHTSDTSATAHVADRMKADGAEIVLLACTELSLLKRDMELDDYHVDMLEILARRAIELSGGKCRKPLTK